MGCNAMKYHFEQFALDTEKLELTKVGELVQLEPQVFALLELLISQCDRVVSKDEINERVWGGRVVSEAALNSRVRSLRKALDDSGKAQRLVKTYRDRGFRFVGEVQAVRVVGLHDVDRHHAAHRVVGQALEHLDDVQHPVADGETHDGSAVGNVGAGCGHVFPSCGPGKRSG